MSASGPSGPLVLNFKLYMLVSVVRIYVSYFNFPVMMISSVGYLTF